MDAIKAIGLYIEYIMKWGIDRNITLKGGASMSSQFQKGAQEVIELAIAYGKYQSVTHDTAQASEELLDGVGDYITCIVQAWRLGGGSAASFSKMLVDTIDAREEACHYAGINPGHKSLELMAQACVRGSVTIALVHAVDFVVFMTGTNLFCKATSQDFIAKALQQAWYEIKDRKGTMINGQFVKE